MDSKATLLRVEKMSNDDNVNHAFLANQLSKATRTPKKIKKEMKKWKNHLVKQNFLLSL